MLSLRSIMSLLVKPSIMLNASLTVLCMYACAVCVSIIEPTQPTEPRCDRPLRSILEKLNPLTESDLVHKRKIELRIYKA